MSTSISAKIKRIFVAWKSLSHPLFDEKGFPFSMENEFSLAKAGFICYKKE
ncbi:hypothetical protein [Mitsuokella multacida]|uniref:hypothetical protein n=1 Tax=Mitsuokella multacida TaxID=52226 RepID=UPI003F7EA11E